GALMDDLTNRVNIIERQQQLLIAGLKEWLILQQAGNALDGNNKLKGFLLAIDPALNFAPPPQQRQIIQKPSPNATQIPGRQIRGIVLHDTEGSEAATIYEFTRNRRASAHYLVAQSGRITQFVLDAGAAWQVRAADRNRPDWLDPAPPNNGVSDVNACTIGIELELLPTDASGAYPAEQIAALKWLVGNLRAKYRLGLERVVTHGWLQSDRADPRGWRMEWLS
ncbi:MAG: N-acetylmuramoyl-L-alanine amidase, partial [Gemmatimonadaceae bacterium]|nr:N-acetylmuramoyl-L-alanine amidase [Gemmatimonadaceae bacterium]